MKNKSKKLFCLCLTSAALLASACNSNKDNKPTFEGEEPVFTDEYYDDYTNMWRRDGFTSELNRMMFQSKNYAMLVESKTGNITGFSALNKEHNEVFDIENIGKLSSKLEIKVEEQYYGTYTSASSRILSEGRYFNQWDNNALSFAGPVELDDILAKIEYTGTRNFVVANFALGAIRDGAYELRYSLDVAGYTVTGSNNELKVVDSNGNGFYVLSLDNQVSITNSGNKIFAEKRIVIEKDKFTGASVFIVPIYNNSSALLDDFKSVSLATVTAKNKRSGLSLPVEFDPQTNSFIVAMESITSPAPSSNGSYDMVDLTVTNNANHTCRPVIRLRKKTGVSITGVNGVLRDFETHEQTGEPVQITKNWHTFPGKDDDLLWDTLRKDHQGPWCYGVFSLELDSKATINREYFQVYGRWGTAYSVAHNQLCLIGWGGSKNELWDQSALGSWGESVTYDPDFGLGRAMIDDVRPFLVYASQGNFQKFNWSGNVGGADFLRYSNADGEQPIVNQRVSYRTTGPNVTEAFYSGFTADGAIKTNININMGRTDDIVRTFYNVRYTFLKDVDYKSLSLFELCADSYADNHFSKYCYGDINGVYAKDQNALATVKLSDAIVATAKDSDFFFGLYDSPDQDEKGDPMYIVRNYNARINGKNYDKAPYKLASTTNSGCVQMGCELALPHEEGKTIKHGSYVEFTVEYDILPNGGKVNNQISYYGESDYIKAFISDMGSHYACLNQVKHGKTIVNVTKGEFVNNSPVTVNAVDDEAEFTITGGLAYVPVLIGNVSDYKGYVLEKKVAGEWVKVDQHVIDDNDYYQVVYDEKTQKYEFGYNVKNDIKKETDLDPTHLYRFHKIGN